MPKTVKVELDYPTAELFKWFCKHEHIWIRAKRELKPGSLVLHFNNKAEIKKKEFHNYEPDPLTKSFEVSTLKVD